MTASPDDIAALRGDGDLLPYLLSLIDTPPSKQAAVSHPPNEEPEYVIPHPGAWPIGTAASGPTPTHGQCACPQCVPKGTP